MTGAAFTRNACELGFGDADRTGPFQSMALTGSFMADGPICCHSLPLVPASPRKPCRIVVAEGRKDEVYGGVSFREPYLPGPLGTDASAGMAAPRQSSR